jgi:hypothetical protein
VNCLADWIGTHLELRSAVRKDLSDRRTRFGVMPVRTPWTVDALGTPAGNDHNERASTKRRCLTVQRSDFM